MRAVVSLALVACVAASSLQHINPNAIHDPKLRELYMKRLSALRQHKRAALVSTGLPGHQSLLPGKSPLIDQTLVGMPEQVQDLKQKQSALEAAQGKLRGTVNTAAVHMNDAAQIKRTIAQKQARMLNQKHRARDLKAKMNHIEATHARLISSLHKNMDPKIERAQAHLKKKQGGLQNEQDAAKYWADQKQKVMMEETQAIEDETSAQKKLHELQGQGAWAEQQEKIASKKAEYDNQMVTEEVQGLNYAKGQYEKEMTRLVAAKEASAQVEASVGADDSMRAMEQVEDAHRAVRAEEDEAENWKDNTEHMQAQADEMLKQNKSSSDNFVEMQTQVAWNKQQQELADKQFKLKLAMAHQERKTLKYVETQSKAEASKLMVAEQATQDAGASVQELGAARALEEQKVQEHLAHGKGKLQNKMQQWQAARAQTSNEIDSLEKQYANWQGNQQQMSQTMAHDQFASATAQQAYEASQEEAFARAEAQAYQFETSASHPAWDAQWSNEGY